ncbi:asparaginase domain-containing protein [Dechloromonas sp. ZS-1]|uniref:asparaginase domain-containing protein n=1 Tax=Dechloromonas sp. ZS-1 TaxID=3138067 RepID=UPI0031FDA3C6
MSISLHLVATGGTIDKRYNPLTGNLDVGEPVLPAILGLAGLSGEAITVHAVLQKDSLDMNDADRALLADTVAALPGRHVLITHGTDTMGLSAACIAARAPAKTVVLTGAMVPYSVDGSDAAFNVGVAYAAVQQLPAGVYIAMHGRVLPHTHYEKDRAAGCFKLR